MPAKLLTRHWIITDANGQVQEVRGDGVVGEQPLSQARPGLSLFERRGARDAGRLHAGQLSDDRRRRRAASMRRFRRFDWPCPACCIERSQRALSIAWRAGRSATCRAAATSSNCCSRASASPADRDRLWFVGDLVNRGPALPAGAAAGARLGDNAVCVLGNHDLHLLAVGAGRARSCARATRSRRFWRRRDRDALLEWLLQRPLAHCDPSTMICWCMPAWCRNGACTQTLQLAAEVQQALRDDAARAAVGTCTATSPSAGSRRSRGIDRLRFTVNVLTRLRFCTRRRAHRFQAQGQARLGSQALDAVVQGAAACQPRRRASCSATGRRLASTGRRACSASTPAASGAARSPR